MATNFSNNDNVIDSRDIIERIEELTDLRDSWEGTPWEESEEAEELTALESLAEEAEGYASDWKYGETLIRDSYFVDYAQELAEDVCEMPRGIKWPYTCIDWDDAADELKQDYTTVDYDGVDYWIRSC